MTNETQDPSVEEAFDAQVADPDEGQPQESEAPEAEGQLEQEEAPEEENPLAGTPYKSVAELVRAHKEIQSRASRAEAEQKRIKENYTKLLPHLLQGRMAEPAKEETTEEALKALLTSPQQYLSERDKAVRAQIEKEAIGPLKAELKAIKVDRDLAEFEATHAWLTAQDGMKMEAILDDYPWIRDIANPMQVLYSLLVASDPEGYSRREKEYKTDSSRVKAKIAAGMGGKKTSVSKPSPGDFWDDVLQVEKDKNPTSPLHNKR